MRIPFICYFLFLSTILFSCLANNDDEAPLSKIEFYARSTDQQNFCNELYTSGETFYRNNDSLLIVTREVDVCRPFNLYEHIHGDTLELIYQRWPGSCNDTLRRSYLGYLFRVNKEINYRVIVRDSMETIINIDTILDTKSITIKNQCE